ncbi:MAG: imidazole glycerol phosphate synthase cyclase subunit [Archangium sp.]|nr:imidazole glycerol phosphate synthase cyclase subunit [Archangium sp.]MDP3575830.1 imidazole glycerol phosphate synthase cyclase subunit [Archangium sp.]
MLRTRLIPVLLLQNGLLVRSESFAVHQVVGNPIHEAKRFNEWNVDELIYLDISRDGTYDFRRDDHKVKSLSAPMEILEEVSKTCFMPLTWGGRIRSVDDMRQCFLHGADKIAINSGAFRNPELITAGAKLFGSQAIVVCVDVKRHADGRAEVFIDGGREPTGADPVDWVRSAIDAGAGEVLLQSLDRDGTARGYDLEIIRAVASVSTVPVIALGGVGRYEHYVEGLRAGADAVAAANIFHFKELSDRNAKRTMNKAGITVRL